MGLALIINPDMLVNLGILAIVVVTVVAVLRYMGIVIPQVVWIIVGAIVGIVLLIWLSDVLKALI